MKRTLYKLLSIGAFCFLLLVAFLLNPSFSYAEAASYNGLTIYHNGTFDDHLKLTIEKSMQTIKSSEIYNQDLHSELCLNDGSVYPRIVQVILGDDVFTAFSNKIVVLGDRIKGTNSFYKWGRKLESSQFLSHALMHNLQYKKHGLFGSNPLGRVPNWKWEGYVEYSIFKDQVSLHELLEVMTDKDKGEFDWIHLSKNKGTIKRHVRYLAMVQYCFNDLCLDYDSFMKSTIPEAELYQQMISKYKN